MDVKLPRLGEGTDSGTVASIFVTSGDQVKKDQPLLELESEKAVATIPSPGEGVVAAVHVKEGDVVKVGQLIMTLAQGGGQAGPAPAARVIDVTVGDEEEEAAEGSLGEAVPAVLSEEESFPAVQEGLLKAGIPPAAAPTVRKVARELGIDLSRIRGTERGGRITMADLRRHIQRLQQLTLHKAPTAHVAPAPEPPKLKLPLIDFAAWGPVERQKITTLRRTIATRMSDSWTSVPRVTQFDEADISQLLALKKKYDPAYENKGGKLTLTAIVLKALTPVLKQHPVVNASLDEANGEIVYKKYYHVGIAVDTDQGLIVPVLRDIDKKSLLQLSIELDDLAGRTRQRKVALEEMQGSSFTISNQGGIGGGHFTPIVNVPEVAILGIGRGVLRPVVSGTTIVPRTMLPLALSYDHRVIDGANAARFMVDIVKVLQTFQESELTTGL